MFTLLSIPLAIYSKLFCLLRQNLEYNHTGFKVLLPLPTALRDYRQIVPYSTLLLFQLLSQIKQHCIKS